MTIKEALVKYKNIEIDLLLGHLLRKPKEFVFLNPEKKLSSYQVKKLSSLIRRRIKGEPIAYILGYKNFYGLRFKVNRDVLIPRPETEMVIDLILRRVIPSEARNPSKKGSLHSASDALGLGRDDRLKILDLGTGSGNIIISLAKSLAAEFYASDVSKKALNIAKFNAEKHSVKIKFIHSDILENVRMSVDVLIGNLPYLDGRWKSSTIKFEPKSALFTKEGGLYLYRKLLMQIIGLKHRPRLIYLEFDPRQKTDLNRLIKKYLPKTEIKFYRDFAGHWRFVEILSAK